MTTSTAIARPDTHDMIVVHRVFRRESDLMPTLIRAVPDGDTARAGVLAQAFSDYQLGLHLHHTGEDELVWPLLLARVDLEADLVLRMEAQHEVVARTLAEASQRMPAWRSAPSAATAARWSARSPSTAPRCSSTFTTRRSTSCRSSPSTLPWRNGRAWASGSPPRSPRARCCSFSA